MGLIQFAGFEALQTHDVAALNRLSGQSGSEGELYQPLDATLEPLVTLSLPELAADDSTVDEDKAEDPSQEDAAVEQLQAFTLTPPVLSRAEETGYQGFMLNRAAVTTASSESGSKMVVEGKLSPALRMLMGTSMSAGEPPAASSTESVAPASAQMLSSLLAKSSGQSAEVLGRFSLSAVAGIDPGAPLDAKVGESSLPDTRHLLAGQLSPQVSRTAEYQWAPARLSDNQTQWGQQLVDLLRDKVELQVNQQVKQAHIRLDPPELGRLELTVKLDGDRLNVQLNVTNPAVRDALIQSMERLRMSLAPHHAGGVEVNVGQGGEQGQQDRWQQEKILAGRRQWQDEPDSQWATVHDWLNTLV
ncbi:flagellar hook-length control protein FliK [Aeromonas sp. EERV15]|uniref:flagellar hook-length control protein FliK n=1 Tax=Aeromonas sp. EERV15 TaxID=1833892 RepID=UPI00083AA3F1|nr:flagellar hook-length control protein FliK [Aeromonas sp. EERV15]